MNKITHYLVLWNKLMCGGLPLAKFDRIEDAEQVKKAMDKYVKFPKYFGIVSIKK